MNLLLASISPAVIDTIAIVFVLIFAILGFIKGFAKLFVKVFGTILSLLLAVLLCASATEFLQAKFGFVSALGVKLEGALTSIFGDKLMNTTLETVANEGLSQNGLNSLIIPMIMSFLQDASIPTNTTLNQIICPTFAYYLIMIISIIVLFIIFKILFFLIGEMTRKMYALRLIAVTDRLLGFLLGSISGIIYLQMITMLVGVIPISFFQEISIALSNTKFVSFVVNVNVFNLIFNGISFNDMFSFVKSLIIKQ